MQSLPTYSFWHSSGNGSVPTADRLSLTCSPSYSGKERNSRPQFLDKVSSKKATDNSGDASLQGTHSGVSSLHVYLPISKESFPEKTGLNSNLGSVYHIKVDAIN